MKKFKTIFKIFFMALFFLTISMIHFLDKPINSVNRNIKDVACVQNVIKITNIDANSLDISEEDINKDGVPKAVTKLIDVTSYNKINSYEPLNEKEQTLFNEIIKRYDTGNFERLYLEDVTLVNYYNIENKAAIYFGDYTNLGRFCDFNVSKTTTSTESYIIFRPDDYNKLKVRKEYIDSKIEEELAKMQEGSEIQKLNQIANFLVNDFSYNLDQSNVYELFLQRSGNCNAYSLAFKMFAERLGIKCDFLTGYVNDNYHAWNRVYLLDGSIRYYDISFYKSRGSISYINQENSLHKVKYVNTYGYGYD